VHTKDCGDLHGLDGFGMGSNSGPIRDHDNWYDCQFEILVGNEQR